MWRTAKIITILIVSFLYYNKSYSCGGCGCNLGYGGNLSTMVFQAPSLIGMGYSWKSLSYTSPIFSNKYTIATYSIYGQYTFKEKYQILGELPYVYAKKTELGVQKSNQGISDPTIGFQYLNVLPIKDDVALFYSSRVSAKIPVGKYDYLDDPLIQPGGGNWEMNLNMQAELGVKRNSIRINVGASKFLYNPKTLVKTGNIYKATIWLSRKFNKNDFSLYTFVGANAVKTNTSYYNGFPITGSKMTLVNSLVGSLLQYKRLGMFLTFYYPVYQSNLYINSAFKHTITIQIFKLL